MAFPFALRVPTKGDFQLLDASGEVVPAMGADLSSPALLVADWWVDPVAGDNANDGLTAGTAVKTVMGGLVPKWETSSPVFPQSVTIHFLNDETAGQEEISLIVTLPKEGTIFSLLGRYVPLATTTLLGVTAKDPAANQPLEVSLTDGFALLSGMFVRNVDKPSRALVVNSGAPPVFIMAQPLTLAPTTPTEVDSWAPGDHVAIERPLRVNVVSLQVEGAGALSCQALSFIDPSGAAGTTACTYTALGAGPDTFRDWTTETLYGHGALSAAATYTNCGGLLGSRCNFAGSAPLALLGGFYTFVNTAVTPPWQANNPGTTLDAACVLDLDIVLSLASTSVLAGSITMGSVCALTPGAPFLSVTGRVMLHVSALSGSNPAFYGNCGVDCLEGGKFTVQTELTFTGIYFATGFQTVDGGNTVSLAVDFTTGAWTAGVVINPANIDANHGIGNPITGSAWAQSP